MHRFINVQKNIKFEYPKDINFLFIDVETANSRNDSLCAIGVFIIKNGEEKYIYSLIDPKAPITNTFVHGISSYDVIGAPTLIHIWNKIILELGNDFIIVGHNINFDICALRKDLNRYGINLKEHNFIDTMAVAQDIYYDFKTKAGDLKLDTMSYHLGISLNHHNAGSDIEATKKILEILLTKGQRKITDFINVKAKRCVAR